MTKLSININKIATLRNARGGDNPNVVSVAKDCELFGAQGITVHPRPDERHIRYADVRELKSAIKTELNIEGYPDDRFCDLVLKVKPMQVTLVPDSPEQITSNSGWDTINNKSFLTEKVSAFKDAGIRTSIFVDADVSMVEHAAMCGTDRVELYTEPYAKKYPLNPRQAIAPFAEAALIAKEHGLGLNAGHDLSLENLFYLVHRIPSIDEVSIGHALICDALYFGLKDTVQRYLSLLT